MNRAPGGQPTGGQFATEARGTDTGVDLGDEPRSENREAVADAYRSRVESMFYGEDAMLLSGFAEDVAQRAKDGDLPDDPELADLDDEWHLYRETPDAADEDWGW